MTKGYHGRPRGKAGRLIFYTRNGKECVRSMPRRVAQTTATKKSARSFGQAVSIAKYLRVGLTAALPPAKDRSMEYRLNAAINQWLSLTARPDSGSEVFSLSSFPFNEASKLQKQIRVDFTVDWSNPELVTLLIPAITPSLQIKAPAHTTKLSWTIVVTGSKIESPELTGTYKTAIEMDWNDVQIPARNIELPYALTNDSINVVAMFMQYTVVSNGRLKNVVDERWLPAGIISSNYAPIP